MTTELHATSTAPPAFEFPPNIKRLLGPMLDQTHRIVGDNLFLAIDVDPATVRHHVPEPLELDGSGRVYVWTFESWVYSDHGLDDFVTPERMTFAETLIWIPCTYAGEQYYFVPMCWSNRDWLAIWGRQVGMPHRIGDVQLTRFHPSDPVYCEPGPGRRVCFSVDQLGRPVQGSLVLREKVPDTDLPVRIGGGRAPKFLGHRFIMDVVSRRPVFNDLVAHWGDDLYLYDVWRGDTQVEFANTDALDMRGFAPRSIAGGWYFRMKYNRNSTPPERVYDFAAGR